MNSYIKKHEFISPSPTDMNSYIKKYEFISPVTYELLHMNSYVSDPSINKMATDGGDGVVDGSDN
jgi:hypothetical protein